MPDGVDFVEEYDRPMQNPYASTEEQERNWEKVNKKILEDKAILAQEKRQRDKQRRFEQWANRPKPITSHHEFSPPKEPIKNHT